jgi:hypothetical protein
VQLRRNPLGQVGLLLTIIGAAGYYDVILVWILGHRLRLGFALGVWVVLWIAARRFSHWLKVEEALTAPVYHRFLALARAHLGRQPLGRDFSVDLIDSLQREMNTMTGLDLSVLLERAVRDRYIIPEGGNQYRMTTDRLPADRLSDQ